MGNTETRITKQGQLPLPKGVRDRLGLTPGARVAWREEDGNLIVRRVEGHTCQDIHDAIFPSTPAASSVAKMDQGIRDRMRTKRARD